MKHIKLNDSGGQSRSVMIETKHGRVEVYCNSDYVAVELYKPAIAKESFQPVFIELNGKVFNAQARMKIRRKDSITLGEISNDPEKKTLVDEFMAASKQRKENECINGK